MIAMRVLAGLLGALFLLAFPAPARGEGVTCAAATPVVPDGRIIESTIPANTTFWYQFGATPGNTYSLEIRSTFHTLPPGLPSIFSESDGCTGTSGMTARDTVTIEPAIFQGGIRISFTNPGGAIMRFRLINFFLFDSFSYSFSVSDTTMFSPGWTTNGSFDTYYSFQNTTGAIINGTLTLFAAGSPVSTSSLAIPPNSAAFTDTATIGAPRNLGGTAKFTHDGPPGAVLVEAAVGNFTVSPAYIQRVNFQAMRDMGTLLPVLLAAPGPAAGGDCFTPITIVPDGRITQGNFLFPAVNFMWFAFSGRPGHSYSLEIRNMGLTGAPTTSLDAVVYSQADGCAGGVPTLTTRNVANVDPAVPAGTTRVTFTIPAGEPIVRIRAFNGSMSPVSFSFSVADTTLFSPGWTTTGSMNTYYSFQNTTSAIINGTLTLFAAGVSVTTTPFAIPANSAAFTDTATLGTPRNLGGTAKVTHDGPPGAVLIEATLANFSISPPYLQRVKFEAVREAR